MRGLLVKDFCIIGKRSRYFLALFIILIAVGTKMDNTFFSSYLSVIVTLFAITTISYDEYDNGMPFILSLPVTRKDYAKEKYLLGLMLGVGATVLSFVFQCAACLMQRMPIEVMSCVETSMVSVPIWTLILVIMLPVELKFGSEKGRIVMFIIYGIVLLLFFAAGKLFETLDVDAPAILQRLSEIPSYVSYIAVIILCAVMWIVSLFISINIMKKKEY